MVRDRRDTPDGNGVSCSLACLTSFDNFRYRKKKMQVVPRIFDCNFHRLSHCWSCIVWLIHCCILHFMTLFTHQLSSRAYDRVFIDRDRLPIHRLCLIALNFCLFSSCFFLFLYSTACSQILIEITNVMRVYRHWRRRRHRQGKKEMSKRKCARLCARINYAVTIYGE